VKYQETLWSELYEGKKHTVKCVQPAVAKVESSLELETKHRKRTVWRLDGGGGSDENLRYILGRGYQVVAKGKSNRRAKALARKVSRWDPMQQDTWVAEVAPPVNLGQPVRFFVRRRLKKGNFMYSYFVISTSLPSKQAFMLSYDQRGAAEVEQFRQDKSGLSLAARRKRSFAGQKALIHLTDLAHNLLADFQFRALSDSKFAKYGPKRIVRDLFQIPGFLHFQQGKLTKIDLCNSNENSKDLIICLEKYIFDD
jgi:hypothetical protein